MMSLFRFAENSNLDAMLFILHTQTRANDQRPHIARLWFVSTKPGSWWNMMNMREKTEVLHDIKHVNYWKCYFPTAHFCYGILSTVGM